MKIFGKFTLTTLCFSIAACSGGSGSSSPATSTATSPSVNPTTTSTITTASTASKATDATGLVDATVAPTSLNVGGKTFNLMPVGNSYNLSLSASNTELETDAEGAQFFGFASEGLGKQRYAFYGSQLAETAALPTTGVIRYEGDVVYSYGAAITSGSDAFEGDANFTADFANKKLTGTFDRSQYGIVSVNADISGTGFNGTATATGTNAAQLTGKFYGTNAAGLAGAFSNGNSLAGAFGADRD